jgi:hypothetical protein
MWYKPYGTTGKKVSVVAFGGMRFANPQDIDANAEVVLHAYRRGVNYFDTAPHYCADKSEDIVGAAVKQMEPGTFYVSTKTFAAEPGKLREDLERSLRRLNVERIHFYHIWCLTTPEVWRKRVEGGGVAEALKAKEEGLIEHVAASVHMRGEELGGVLVDAPLEGVTLGYCAINFPYREAGVRAAAAKGLGVITMNPLGGGLIPRNPERFDFLRGPDDRSVVEAAIRFNVSHPDITAALVGFTTPEHVDQACDAVEDFQPYPREHYDRLRDGILDSFDGLCTGCGYCLPCPQGVDIPKMMDAYNQKILGDGQIKAAIGRLKGHWQIPLDNALACSLCGACEDKCTQHLPIRERMEEIKAAVDQAKEAEKAKAEHAG